VKVTDLEQEVQEMLTLGIDGVASKHRIQVWKQSLSMVTLPVTGLVAYIATHGWVRKEMSDWLLLVTVFLFLAMVAAWYFTEVRCPSPIARYKAVLAKQAGQEFLRILAFTRERGYLHRSDMDEATQSLEELWVTAHIQAGIPVEGDADRHVERIALGAHHE
jgi:hypothetical protein